MEFKMYTLFVFNSIAFLYLIINMLRELNFKTDKNETTTTNYHKTPCNIYDDNVVCGSDLKYYPNVCIARRNGITQYTPKIACEVELAKKYCQ